MTAATQPPAELPFGTALALAQRTLSAPLTAILDTEGIAMPVWFTLNALGLRGPTPLDVLAGLLAPNGLDAAAARELVAGLERSGLAELRDGVVTPTVAGAERYVRLRDRIGQATARIFEPFDAGRVEAARALLQELAGLDPVELTQRTVR